jgi:hypothetical protein
LRVRPPVVEPVPEVVPAETGPTVTGGGVVGSGTGVVAVTEVDVPPLVVGVVCTLTGRGSGAVGVVTGRLGRVGVGSDGGLTQPTTGMLTL